MLRGGARKNKKAGAKDPKGHAKKKEDTAARKAEAARQDPLSRGEAVKYDHHEAWGLTLDTVAPLEPARGLLEQQERELLCGGAQDFVFLSDDGVEMIDDVSHTEQARERREENYFLSSWLSYMIARLYTISHDCGRNIIIPGRPPLPNPSPLRPSKTHSAMRER